MRCEILRYEATPDPPPLLLFHSRKGSLPFPHLPAMHPNNSLLLNHGFSVLTPSPFYGIVVIATSTVPYITRSGCWTSKLTHFRRIYGGLYLETWWCMVFLLYPGDAAQITSLSALCPLRVFFWPSLLAFYVLSLIFAHIFADFLRFGALIEDFLWICI